MNQNNPYIEANTLIVGSGVVGACLAIKLAQEGRDLVIVDSKKQATITDWQTRLAQRDSRVFALNLASIQLLKDIGVWQYITKQQRQVDYTQIHVWQTNGFGELSFADKASQKNGVPLGSMIEPSVIEYAIAQRLQDDDISKNITVINNHKLVAIHEGYDAVSEQIKHIAELAEFSDNQQQAEQQTSKISIKANLLVGADGMNSSVRQLAGIALDTLEYQQTAICCAIKTEKPHDLIARQAMLPTGTLALLPLADQQSAHWQSVVWTLPDEKIFELTLDKNKQEQILADELAFASSYELGKIETIESISMFPLIARQAKTYTKEKLVLIGDAAHGIHPLAGQGLNLGLADVTSLADILIEDSERMSKLNIKNKASYWGHWYSLQKYEQDRRAKNSHMMHGCSVLNWTFAGQFAQLSPLQQLRSEGMSLVGKQRWLMDWFNKQASGL